MERIYRVSEVAREIGRCEKWPRETERRGMIPHSQKGYQQLEGVHGRRYRVAKRATDAEREVI